MSLNVQGRSPRDTAKTDFYDGLYFGLPLETVYTTEWFRLYIVFALCLVVTPNARNSVQDNECKIRARGDRSSLVTVLRYVVVQDHVKHHCDFNDD